MELVLSNWPHLSTPLKAYGYLAYRRACALHGAICNHKVYITFNRILLK